MRISVIIPTLNAGQEITALLDRLQQQVPPADEITVVDSGSADGTAERCEAYDGVTVIRIRREAFDHGGTRDMALRQARGDIAVFLTQDAMPADETFLKKLTAPFAQDERIAASTGRQLPKEDAREMERLVREYNYPAESNVRSKDDLPKMGIKTYFCSDACCAYRKDIYLTLGGFDHPLQTNEDMFFAAKAIHAGYRIAYTADAKVYHSHNLTLKEQYRRNYLQGYEIEKRKDELGIGAYGQEGLKLARTVAAKLLKAGQIRELIRFLADCCARKLGNAAGERACRRERDQAQRKA